MITKEKEQPDTRPYRPCAGVMLINPRGRVFVGKRIDTLGDHWQMPQGGIDDGESPEEAAWRELKEETGIHKARLLAESAQWRKYDLPPELSYKKWKGRYRGQTQKWFLMLFEGTGADIQLDAGTPEFSHWQWIEPEALEDLIVPFKRALYADVVREFAPLIQQHLQG